MQTCCARNILRPTRYRLRVAEQFSHAARKIFPDDWKGLYVVGSVAQRQASFLSDVDVFPIVLDLDWNARKGPAWEKLKELIGLRARFELVTGITVDVWIEARQRAQLGGHASHPCTIGCLQTIGLAHAINGPAILVDGDTGLGLPPEHGSPRTDSRSPMYAETLDGVNARIQYVREQQAFRIRLANTLRTLLPSYPFGEWEAVVIAAVILKNLYPGMPKAGTYPHLYHVFLHEPAIRTLLSRPPIENELEAEFNRFFGFCHSGASLHWRTRLSELNHDLRANGFQGIAENLFDPVEALKHALQAAKRASEQRIATAFDR